MKIIKTLFFILISLKLDAQSEIPQYEPINFSKPKWDITTASGFAKRTKPLIGLQSSLSGRFNHHLYASMSYMSTLDVSVLFAVLFPKIGYEEVNNFSIVTGVHYSEKYFFGALGIGLGRSKIKDLDFFTGNESTVQTYGLEIKAQTSVIIWKYIGLGLIYNYNFNHIKNFHSIMFGWQFGLLR